MSCQNELNTLGGDILGQDELSGRIQKAEFEINTYNALLNPIETGNFRSVWLGTYNDPTFGRSTYEFVSQLSLTTTVPNFGNNAVVKSVILDIPYFSRLIEVDGLENIYRVDSLYRAQPVDVEIWENGYFLNSFDPANPTEPATYYNDLKPLIEANKVTLLEFIDDYIPSESEILETSVNEDGETVIDSREAPRLKLELDEAFFQTKIIDAQGTTNLDSNSEFQNYFRGLYFKISSSIGSGNLIGLDIQNASINILIDSTFDLDNDPSTPETTVESNIPLSFAGRTVNLIDTDLQPSIVSSIQSSNSSATGAQNLYLKGGPGSIAVLELFGPDVDMNGEADELTTLKQNNWLINEASIELYVDQDALNPIADGTVEPERIIIYNLDDNVLLADYFINFDDFGPLNSLTNHLGRLERVDNEDEESEGVKYKIRLTEHIRGILSGDRDNDRLGIAVTQNVRLSQNNKVLNQTSPIEIKGLPQGAAYSHEGTILHGNLSPNVDKRPKLELYYTPIEE